MLTLTYYILNAMHTKKNKHLFCVVFLTNRRRQRENERRRILAEAKSFGQFEPERAAGGASQHERGPAAITYSEIFSPYR